MKTEPPSHDEKLERVRRRVKVEHFSVTSDGDSHEEEGREDDQEMGEMVTVEDIVKEEHSIDEDDENERLVGSLTPKGRILF